MERLAKETSNIKESDVQNSNEVIHINTVLMKSKPTLEEVHNLKTILLKQENKNRSNPSMEEWITILQKYEPALSLYSHKVMIAYLFSTM